MKYFIYLSIFLTSNFAFASSDDDVVCSFEGQSAELTMYFRQEGKSMAEAMKGASDSSKNLIIRAYEHPRFSTEENKNKAAKDFANEITLECYKRRMRNGIE